MTKSKSKNIDIITIILILLAIGLFLFLPQLAMESFFAGIRLWATKVLPALLPFFILVKLLSATTFSSRVGSFLSPITHKMYGVGGVAGYIYIMSILSGYPVGAKLTADIYKDGGISKGQAHSISSFTSTSGPLFVLGTVGIGLFHSQKLGIIVLISHYLGALLNGLIYRNKEKNTNVSKAISHVNITIGETMSSSIGSILLVGGFVALFYMLLSLLLHIGAFTLPCQLLSYMGIPSEIATSIFSGIVEVTTGASLLSRCTLAFHWQAIILSFLISFGGLSIHMQAYCYLSSFDMPYHKFLIQKITHAIFSSLITAIIVFAF